MERDNLSRKLAVILHADVVGSTSLVQQNETLAHQRIQNAFHHFSETISSYGGITHELRGDALVAEFNRVSDAVPAAIAFQTLNEEVNNALDDDVRPQLRIGISLGEVVIADNTITGAGVVLAQRLEQLATPGGVVIQGSVSETLPDRMPFELESLGEQMVKGFDQPVRAFVARLQLGKELPAPDATATPLSAEQLNPNVSDKPSIAVLPFQNMGGDPEQRYFSEGMTMNICAQLSRIRSLKVKLGANFDLSKTQTAKIADELGVNYVLRGSVQKEADRVKVFVEFTECKSGEIKWSEIFDRRGNNIMDIQDEITTAITGSLWSYRGVIRDAERENLTSKSTQDFNAFDYILKGVYHKEKITREDLKLAHEYLDRAKQLDPGSAEAFAWSAWAHIVGIFMGWAENYTTALDIALAEARNAITLDPFSEIGHWALGAALVMNNDQEHGFEEYDNAIEINPNNPDFMVTKGRDLAAYGRFDEGIDLIQKGFKFNHHHAEWYFWYQGMAYFAAARFEDAIKALNRLSHQNKDTRIYLAASYAQIGDIAEAQFQANELLQLDPETNLEEIAAAHSYLHTKARQRLVDSIELAMGTGTPKETFRTV